MDQIPDLIACQIESFFDFSVPQFLKSKLSNTFAAKGVEEVAATHHALLKLFKDHISTQKYACSLEKVIGSLENDKVTENRSSIKGSIYLTLLKAQIQCYLNQKSKFELIQKVYKGQLIKLYKKYQLQSSIFSDGQFQSLKQLIHLMIKLFTDELSTRAFCILFKGVIQQVVVCFEKFDAQILKMLPSKDNQIKAERQIHKYKREYPAMIEQTPRKNADDQKMMNESTIYSMRSLPSYDYELLAVSLPRKPALSRTLYTAHPLKYLKKEKILKPIIKWIAEDAKEDQHHQ